MSTKRSATELINAMKELRNENKSKQLMRFFKTSKGEYGYGDKFLGIKNPEVRMISKEYHDLDLSEIQTLIKNEYHEIRLCGFLILVLKYHKLSAAKIKYTEDSKKKRDEIIDFYIKNANYANNWDLVDLTTPQLLGNWMVDDTTIKLSEKEQIIDNLANSDNLWKKRMSMVFTWTTSRFQRPDYAIKYAKLHLNHSHDLMHKAVGWMLREVGKNCSMDILREFLTIYAAQMPRTALRYAIEKMDEDERQQWLNYKG